MDRLLAMDQEQYLARMQGEVRRTLEQVAAAVNGAADGFVIGGSEMRVRELMVELQRRAFETAVQMRIDSTESSFSPSQGRIGAEQAEEGSKQPQHAERQRKGRCEPGSLVRPRRRQ